MGKRVTQNKEIGNQWEELFRGAAQRNGFLVMENHLCCRYTYGGRVQVIKGELDFRMVSTIGQVGYFDCKAFCGDRFNFSDLDAHQIERSELYNDWGIPSGFVIWFYDIKEVFFFSGHYIARKGSGTSFVASEGQALGRFESFDVKAIMRRPRRTKEELRFLPLKS